MKQIARKCVLKKHIIYHQRYLLTYIHIDTLSKDILDFAGISQCCLIAICQCAHIYVCLSAENWWKEDGIRPWFMIVLNNCFEKAFILCILWPPAFTADKIKVAET